jgi:DNA-directed RNA polymerase I subunit RPA1
MVLTTQKWVRLVELNFYIEFSVKIAILGAADRSGICPVCYQMSRGCPGHMGHISLPLPIYNPMFFKTVIQVSASLFPNSCSILNLEKIYLQILKGSCFQCKAIICDPMKVPIFLRQMEALDRGNRQVAMDIPMYAQNFLANNPSARLTDLERRLDDVMQELLGGS